MTSPMISPQTTEPADHSTPEASKPLVNLDLQNLKTYQVAVDAPLPQVLTYLAPVDGQALKCGQSVVVPLGKRTAQGVVLSAEEISSPLKLKAILAIDEERPLVNKSYLQWLTWLSEYYLHPIGQVAETLFPPLKKAKAGSAKRSKRAPVVTESLNKTPPPALTEEQTRVLGAIQSQSGFQVHLLHGVTGSGKTEVYLRLLESVLAKGQQGLVLVPEISLTPQLIDRFSQRFPNTVAVLHSHLTEREKTNQWWSAVDGQKRILIGARSALFCPLPELGFIILDEEHEPSYKQDEKLKYHARDAAIVLAQNLNIPIVLGSATPSLESWRNALSGKFKLQQMHKRVQDRPLPDIEVVDLRAVHRSRKDAPSELPFWLSDRLYEELKHVFAKKEQAALFLNRRGIAQTCQCPSCGYVAECPNCSVSLTVHGHSHLVCHYCDYSERLAENCPECRESALMPLGMGTEKIEADMAQLFPEIRMARADRDEIQSREHLEKMISDIETEQVDLLIGTQMIAKGLDFPKLNLVGLVLADVGFHWPDFRASERSFQLLTQVSGRSGRQTAGRVVIQTYDPTHNSIQHTCAGSFAAFAEYELKERSELFYPPAWRMAMIRITSGTEGEGENTGHLILRRAQLLQKQVPAYAENLLVLGPARAPLSKLRGRFRYQVLIKCDSSTRLNKFCRQLLNRKEWIPKGTKVQVDIDPFQML